MKIIFNFLSFSHERKTMFLFSIYLHENLQNIFSWKAEENILLSTYRHKKWWILPKFGIQFLTRMVIVLKNKSKHFVANLHDTWKRQIKSHFQVFSNCRNKLPFHLEMFYFDQVLILVGKSFWISTFSETILVDYGKMAFYLSILY